MNLPLANYKEEQKQFQELIEDLSSKRILMFKGESGSGKTRLVEWCISQIPSHMRYLSVQLRSSDTTISHILYRLGRSIGWDRLNTFTQHIATLSKKVEIEGNNWRLEIREHLDKLLQVENLERRKHFRDSITNAWFEDAKTFHTPILLILDTYEEATSELDQWFCQYFLPWIVDIYSVRVLVAGQTVPQQSSDWSYCCNYSPLKGVHDAEAWLPVAYAMGREIASIDYLAGACAMANGNPSKILDFIRILPETHRPLNPSQTIANKRRRWRENMIQGFSLLDLHELCFDFYVDFESIGESNNLRAKILGLFSFMEKRGRLPELIARCRELRADLDW